MSKDLETTNEKKKTFYSASTIAIALTIGTSFSIFNLVKAYREYSYNADVFKELLQASKNKAVELYNTITPELQILSHHETRLKIMIAPGGINIPEETTTIIKNSIQKLSDATYELTHSSIITGFCYFARYKLDLSDQHLCQLVGISDQQCHSIINFLESPWH